MYSVRAYGRMIRDRDRTSAYAAALRHAITPESVVVDIGTGTGVFATYAAKIGARKVYAIEPEPVIQVARESAMANGCAERIEFIETPSDTVTLPEKADVIVSDIRGVLPFADAHLPSIMDARDRFLRSGGILIPRRDTLRAALSEVPDVYEGIVGPFVQHPLELDASAEARMALQRWYRESFKPDQLLSDSVDWYEIDYRTVETTNASGGMRLEASRAGTAHGFALWFEADLGDGIHYSSGPSRKDSVYGTAFFPFLEPPILQPGESIAVHLEAKRVGEDYVWTWKTTTASGTTLQSDFLGTSHSPAALARRAPAYAAELDEPGTATLRALGLMDGNHSNREIARILHEENPLQFPTSDDALQLVGRLAAEYGL